MTPEPTAVAWRRRLCNGRRRRVSTVLDATPPKSEASHRAPGAPHGTVASRRSTWLWNGFQWYLARYLKRHFHTIAVMGQSPAVAPGRPDCDLRQPPELVGSVAGDVSRTSPFWRANVFRPDGCSHAAQISRLLAAWAVRGRRRKTFGGQAVYGILRRRSASTAGVALDDAAGPVLRRTRSGAVPRRSGSDRCTHGARRRPAGGGGVFLLGRKPPRSVDPSGPRQFRFRKRTCMVAWLGPACWSSGSPPSS